MTVSVVYTDASALLAHRTGLPSVAPWCQNDVDADDDDEDLRDLWEDIRRKLRRLATLTGDADGEIGDAVRQFFTDIEVSGGRCHGFRVVVAVVFSSPLFTARACVVVAMSSGQSDS